jgi:uncharacterized HAD superfamily protein
MLPQALSLAALGQATRNLPSRLKQAGEPAGRQAMLKKAARTVLGENGYQALKGRLKRAN